MAELLYPNNTRKISDHIHVLGPQNDSGHFDLTIAALIHGNEYGGLQALNIFLKQLAGTDVKINKSLCIVLGNIHAAEKNVRYVERDLNRCFGRSESTIYEDRVAREIEPFLSRSRFFIDLHQTVNPTKSDFYIFPEFDRSIKWANFLSDNTPIVVHGKEFSADGMCADGFVSECGGTAITYEMGQIGKDPASIEKAARILMRAYLSNLDDPKITEPPVEVYTWSEIISTSPGRVLVPGLINFAPICQGDILANDSYGEIRAKSDGYVLFPKYGNSVLNSSELCRVVSVKTMLCEEQALNHEASITV